MTPADISAGSMPTTSKPRANRAWLAPPGELPISANRAARAAGNCDHAKASSIFNQARLTALDGLCKSMMPPGQREGTARARR